MENNDIKSLKNFVAESLGTVNENAFEADTKGNYDTGDGKNCEILSINIDPKKWRTIVVEFNQNTSGTIDIIGFNRPEDIAEYFSLDKDAFKKYDSARPGTVFQSDQGQDVYKVQ